MGNGFKLNDGRFKLDKRKIHYCEGGEALEQIAQRGSGCPITGVIQSQTGRGSEQPEQAVGIPTRCRGVGLNHL